MSQEIFYQTNILIILFFLPLDLAHYSNRLVMNDKGRFIYSSNLYVGPCPSIIREAYHEILNLTENTFCIIVPRFAHVVMIKKTMRCSHVS